ncbi:MAG: LuxR C-terminal-related transcriptional regulator [Actinomycetota bacterium]|nr:LuxR C-terminal-related transcriptional regulator [Actinomycetota bacterium]
MTGDRFAVGAATLSLLSRFAEEHPLLLLVDDAHTLDRPSADALVFVARRVMADPIAVLAASRPEPGTLLVEAGLPQLQLQGLELAMAEELMAVHARAVVTPDVVARLHRATGGNPLAMVELAGDIERLERLSPQVPLPVPDAVAGSFGRRIATLGERARVALLLAAITDGDMGLVARASTALGTTIADLAMAEQAGLIRIATGRLEFRHPLVQSSAYAAASPDLRRDAHRAIAHALPDHDVERRAWNLCEATVGPNDEVADAVDLVGRRARDRSADGVAATAFERAALLTAEPGRRAGRILAAGQSAWYAGQVERAGALLQQAAALACDPVVLAGIDGLRGSIAARAGSLEDARDIWANAAARIAQDDPDGAVLLLADSVNTCFYLGDAAAALKASETLDGLVARSLTDQARVLGTLAVGMAHVLAGEPGMDRIRGAVRALATSPDRTGDPHRPAWVVMGPLFLRESETGRELVRRTVEDLRERAALATLPNLLFHLARDEPTTDRWQSALSGYQEAIGLAREAGQTTDLTLSLAGLAWLQARMGRESDCRTNAAEAMRLGHRHRIHLGRAWVAFAQGDLELALGRPAQAVAHFTALQEMLDRIGFLDVDLAPGPELVEALKRVRRHDEALVVSRRYHVHAAAKAQPWAMARAERALAITAQDAEAKQAHFDMALDLHRSSLDAYEEARTRLLCGAALRRERRRAAARPLLRSALRTFEVLGAKPWADLAARELDATGERPRRGGDSRVSMLTTQEHQIAGLLAAGRTTRETAAALFLSPKTVEYHLRHAYIKLGIHSRPELTAAFASSGERPTETLLSHGG